MGTNGGSVRIFTDGASRGNPGPSGIGYQIYDRRGNLLLQEAVYIGEVTNNIAEYTALITALEKASIMTSGNVACFSDSEVMARQLNGEYKVRDEKLVPLHKRALKLASRFAAFTISHVPREQNKEADRLSNEAIDNLDKRPGERGGIALPGCPGEIAVLDVPEVKFTYGEVLEDAVNLLRKGSKKVNLVGPDGLAVTAYRVGGFLRIDIGS